MVLVVVLAAGTDVSVPGLLVLLSLTAWPHPARLVRAQRLRVRVLPFVDYEMIQRLQEQLKLLGLKFMLGHRMTAIKRHADHVQLTLDNDKVFEFDIVLVASGRQSNVQELGLAQIGVNMGSRGLILVNDKYQTSVPNIYAAVA